MCLVDGASFVSGRCEELAQFAGEGGGGEPAEVSADGHCALPTSELHGPVPPGAVPVVVVVCVVLFDFNDEWGAGARRPAGGRAVDGGSTGPAGPADDGVVAAGRGAGALVAHRLAALGAGCPGRLLGR